VKYGLFGSHLLGDALMQTPAIRALRSLRPEAQIEYYHSVDMPGAAMFEGNPHLDRLEVLAVWPRSPRDYPLTRFGAGDAVCPLDALHAYRWGERHGRTLAEGFGHALGVAVTDLRYDYAMTDAERARGRALADKYGAGRPVVVVARHSASCHSNAGDGTPANKCVANRHWYEVSTWLGRQGFQPLAIGTPSDALDERYAAWEGARAYDVPIRDVAGLLAASHAVLSVDTGIRHLAAAVGANLYCVSGAIPLSLIRCVPVRDGQRIHEAAIAVSDVDARILVDGASTVL
jgi:ADP-heptose:LPS heptosyltransferase